MTRLLNTRWLVIGVVGALLLELSSFIHFFIPESAIVIVLLLTIAFAVIAWKDISYGIYALVIELALSGHGYMLRAPLWGHAVALRHIWFVLLIAVFAVKVLNSDKHFFARYKGLFSFLYPLLIVTGFAVLVGYARGNALADVFFDGNAYAFLLLIFPLVYAAERSFLYRAFANVLFGALSVLSTKTLVTLLLFSYRTAIVPAWYLWVRDLRFGEITSLGLSFYRVFFQSQIFLILALFIIASYAAVRFCRGVKLERREAFLLTFLSGLYLASYLVSFSRSFWLGTLVGIVVWSVILFTYGFTLSKLFRLAFRFVPSLIIAILLIMIMQAQFWNPASLFYRAGTLSGEPSIETRWALLPSMWDEIQSAPVFGSGFGSRITYISDDPRIRAATDGTGEYSTFSFEWGFLDIWFKMGFVGIIFWFIFIAFIFKNLIKAGRRELSVFPLAFLGALSSLVVIHFFTPYLNHPLGISFLLLAVPYVMEES